MQEKIKKYLSFFETIKRNDNDIVVLKNDAPQELRDSVYKAHGNRMPDDWIYDKYQSILKALSSYTIEDLDELDEKRGEIVNNLVDVYTSDLTAWLNSSNYNVYYLSEALEDNGENKDGFKLLAMAQYKAIDEIFAEVFALLDQSIK